MGPLSPDGVVEEFQERFRHSDLRNKMPELEVVANGPVVELTLIAVPRRNQGKGYATRALQMLIELCDKAAITITLIARPMDECAPGCPATRTTDELIAWYKGHGFVDLTFPGDDTHPMERKPRAGKGLKRIQRDGRSRAE